MNFEECKKVMNQYLNAEITKEDLLHWAGEHCNECTERVCHCAECPMFIEKQCLFLKL